MSEVEREQPQEVTLPIEWHVPENLQGHYANNVLVQPGQFERDAFDELEWHNIVSTPHVRHGLRRLAAEARREYYAGETEEGGFALD